MLGFFRPAVTTAEAVQPPKMLEEALVQHEKNLDPALKQAGQMMSALKSWKKATTEGNLAERNKQAAKARTLAASIAEPVESAAASWEFDGAQYLAQGTWRQDLIAAANAVGHRLFEEGEDIVSSPVVVTADAQRLSLRIGKVRWPKLRASVTAVELKRLRERGEKEKRSQDLLETLHGAARHLDKSGDDAVKARVRDIYDLFALAPGWKKENSESSFAQDLYALHKSEVRVTRGGKKYEFEFPSGQPNKRDVFSIIDESGRPIRYYMIHFR